MKIYAAWLKCMTLTVCVLPFSLAAQQDAEPTTIPVPAGYTSLLNTTYVTVGDWEGKMDLYLPPKTNGPSPVVIKIHGGGWNHGSRVSPGGMYFHMGFALVSVEYRLVQIASAPAAIEDSRCALKYVIDHAAVLNIDTKRIVLEGGSAGGHLALMTGLLGNDRRFDGNCPGTPDMNVAAIVDDYGPTDFTKTSRDFISKNKSVVNWLGTHVGDEVFKASVSPISYVTVKSPPVIIFHGTEDHTVPIEQTDLLEKKLKDAGVKTEVHMVEDAGHGRFTHDQMAEEEKEIASFLKSVGVTH